MMSIITVRRLEDDLKRRLRVLAAEHGRSMEEEVRHILAARLAQQSQTREPPSFPAPVETPAADRSLSGRRVLLIIGGGIAAYKSLDLIRRLKERGAALRTILTASAQQFITPLSAGALAGERPFVELFDQSTEFDVGHIRLARDTDVVVVAPATANLMARMAGGHADDLATAVLLATDKPILIAPAMNPRMWSHPATQRNFAQLRQDGVAVVGPHHGEMAERGEAGLGRMAEPLDIVAALKDLIARSEGPKPLRGRRIVITSGPTHEPIDPVRYIANRSSGKQGHAIARAAAAAGADVVLVSGPVNLPDPPGVTVRAVETARDMLAVVEQSLPADVGIFAAAVADWRVAEAGAQKIKKGRDEAAPRLSLVENPDILAAIARHPSMRPPLVIGFAAETQNVIEYAKAKRAKKGCDWILANDVSPETGIMGGDDNTISLVTASNIEAWPPQSKAQVADRLVEKIAAFFAQSAAPR